MSQVQYRLKNYVFYDILDLKVKTIVDSVLRNKSKEIAKQIVILCRGLNRKTQLEEQKEHE